LNAPTTLTRTNAKGHKGRSEYELPLATMHIGGGANVVFDGTVQSNGFDMRDLLSIFHFEDDPRFEGIGAKIDGRTELHVALGGPEDKCHEGYMTVRSDAHVSDVDLFGEHFEEGDLRFDLRFPDRQAGLNGAELEVDSFSLHKVRRSTDGAAIGSVLGSASILRGGELRGSAVVEGIPLSRVQTLTKALPQDALLDGAAAMDERTSREDMSRNPAAMIAYLLVELGQQKGKVNHVMMPYSNGLYLLADWYRQLWAESLGKKFALTGEEVFAGFTPIKALGTTDQHSQVQLYREGPNDKVFCLVEVESMEGADVRIPTGLGVEAIAYLEGKSMHALLNAEKRATEYALVESRRPNFTIRFPKVDAHHVGEFIFLWEMVTAYAGLMLNIDAYDQPAVELGKQATFGLMGRAGYEKHLRLVNQTLAASPYVIRD